MGFKVRDLSDSTVHAAVSGDAEALNRLATLSRARVEAMVAARLPPDLFRHDLVEDLVQEILLALSSGISALKARSLYGFRGYLSSVVRNQVAQHLRGRARTLPTPPPAEFPGAGGTAVSSGILLLESIHDQGQSPSSDATRLELFQQLMLELAELKPSYREALTLAFFDQLTTRQIAETLDLTRPNAAMLVLRATDALRKRWRLREQPDPEGREEA